MGKIGWSWAGQECLPLRPGRNRPTCAQCSVCPPALGARTPPTQPRGKEPSGDLGPPVSGSGVITQRPDISHAWGSPETPGPAKSEDLFPLPHGLSFITEFLVLSLPSIHSAFTPSDKNESTRLGPDSLPSSLRARSLEFGPILLTPALSMALLKGLIVDC